MNIGIDAKWFFQGPVSNRIVVQQLVKHLIFQLPSDCHLHLFLSLDDKSKPVPFRAENVYWHYVWAKNNQLSNLFVLPIWAKKLKIDVLLYQNFISPWGKHKKIAYIHDFIPFSHPEYYTWKERLYFSTLPYLCSKADKIITISESEKKRIANYVRPTPPIEVVRHGITDDFKTREQFSSAEIERVRQKYQLPEQFLLFVGRLNIRKNIQNLLLALPHLNNTSIPLVIVGQEEWKTYNFQQVIDEYKLSSRLHFTGHTEYKDLLVIYAMATVFCFPSFCEGFGLPPLEAMASGTPVVVGNNSSLPEVCGAAGCYVDVHDPKSIAQAINELLDNADYYALKRKKSIKQAATFSWEKAAKELLNAITK
jgi:glycosyltransferase involved in cell wall biosynthesis